MFLIDSDLSVISFSEHSLAMVFFLVSNIQHKRHGFRWFQQWQTHIAAALHISTMQASYHSLFLNILLIFSLSLLSLLHPSTTETKMAHLI
jgi:hypothetical protein